MASSSIFIYELRSPAEINVESIYSRLKGYPEDENTYFNLEMISANELLGEYVIVQNAQESYYNPEQRVFEYRIVPKANVISFSITDDFLEIWGNKTSANKLVFELSNLLALSRFSLYGRYCWQLYCGSFIVWRCFFYPTEI